MDIAYDKKRKCDVMACDLKEEDRGSFRYKCKYCGEDLILVLPKKEAIRNILNIKMEIMIKSVKNTIKL